VNASSTARPLPPPKLDFDTVFDESSAYVWRLLARLGVSSVDLPDVCQEVFLTVHRRLEDYDGGAPLRSWVYGICVRTAANYRKRAHRRRETVGDPPDTGAPAGQHRELELSRARARLFGVLATLDEGKRDAFVLFELEELPMREVARILDCPLQTAYSRLHAAREAVVQAFRDDERPVEHRQDRIQR
jgi:RNA polymerase sigma-70 factor (ECF subfamily)